MSRRKMGVWSALEQRTFFHISIQASKGWVPVSQSCCSEGKNLASPIHTPTLANTHNPGGLVCRTMYWNYTCHISSKVSTILCQFFFKKKISVEKNFQVKMAMSGMLRKGTCGWVGDSQLTWWEEEWGSGKKPVSVGFGWRPWNMLCPYEHRQDCCPSAYSQFQRS